ncbi:IS21 family transposase [Thalassoroseus pseudoceratinae]|uniref:IS21 family transposase n=1 Tax=Thalassoroseus pseudoceratinae TaxID=2713176 RepID=UPI00141F1EC4|nr:IS21 family transposase [Thalassoroseus pseudoceratinae]
MTMWTEIRRLVLTGQKSKRAICREYEIHWKTLQKILTHEEPPGYRQSKPRPRPKLDPFVPMIHEMLKSDRTSPPKQRHTAKRVFDRLREEHGYTGGLTVVQEEVRRWREQSAEVFMPLSQLPGTAQADFGEAQVILNGEPTKVAYFVMSLPYSDAFFCQVFPKECTETFQEGHCRAFEFFGGVPKRISYDNSKIAVSRIVGKRGETPTREFLRLESHFLFEHHFCLVRRPNEKGHTENLVGFARRNFMVPMPVVNDLEEFNQELVRRCEADLQRRLRGQPARKAELLKDDQAAFLALPKSAFESRRLEGCRANSLSLVRFDCNDYSVPTAYGHQRVLAIGGISEVRFVVGDRVVARHPRDWRKEQVHYDPKHYLALLERKPGSLDFAKPFEDWPLPSCFAILRRRLEGELGSQGRREFIQVLRLLETYSLKTLADALDRALKIGAFTVDAIRLLAECSQEQPAKWFRLDGRPHLQGHDVPLPKLNVYATLTSGGAR